MRPFQSIVVVVSGAEAPAALLGRAVDVARRSGATITLIDVLEALSPDLRRLFPERPVLELRSLALRRRREDLEKLALSVSERGVTASTKVLWGTPSREIVQATNCAALTVRPDTYIAPWAFEVRPALLERRAS